MDTVNTTVHGYVLNNNCRSGSVGIQEAIVTVECTVFNCNALDSVSGDSIVICKVNEVYVLNGYLGSRTGNSNAAGVLVACTVNSDALRNGYVFSYITDKNDCVACLCSVNSSLKSSVLNAVKLCYVYDLVDAVYAVYVNYFVNLRIKVARHSYVKTCRSCKSCIYVCKYKLSVLALTVGLALYNITEAIYSIRALELEGLNGGFLLPNVDRRDITVLKSDSLFSIVLDKKTVFNVCHCYVLKSCGCTVYPVDTVNTAVHGYVLYNNCRSGSVGIQEAIVTVERAVFNCYALNCVSSDSIVICKVNEVHVLNGYSCSRTGNGNVAGVLEVCTVNSDALRNSYVLSNVTNKSDCVACLCSLNCLCKSSVLNVTDLCYGSKCRNKVCNVAVATYGTSVGCVTAVIKCRSSYYCLVLVTKCFNNCLCNENYVTYGAVRALGKTGSCASRSYCIVNNLGVTLSC